MAKCNPKENRWHSTKLYEWQRAEKHYNLVDVFHSRLNIRSFLSLFILFSFVMCVCVLSMFKGAIVILQVTSTSIDHMNCFGDAAGRVQECGISFNPLIFRP